MTSPYACTIHLAPISPTTADRILNCAARELWPALWPLISDLVNKTKGS